MILLHTKICLFITKTAPKTLNAYSLCTLIRPVIIAYSLWLQKPVSNILLLTGYVYG